MSDKSWRLMKGDKAICFLIPRPPYCDRGRYHLLLHTPIWRSDADQKVRYYFDLERGQLEVEEYMKAKGVNLEDSFWEEDIPPLPEPYQQEGLRCD